MAAFARLGIVVIPNRNSVVQFRAGPAMKKPMERASGLIVAAGASRRMGFDKITARLAGRPVLAWSLAAFEACEAIGPSVLVCPGSRREEFEAIAAPFAKFRWVVPGGTARAESVLNGLSALETFSPRLVAVHDAARPLVTPALIWAVVAAASDCGSSVAAEPVSDTLHRAGHTGLLAETVSRDRLWAMQTPQVAGYSVLRTANEFESAAGNAPTDEISALIRAGLRPQPVAHDGWNFKVTYPRDIALAEAVLALRKSPE
ncbi:MAG: IspD/TarI family cytidylyltransferase [Verrucomicrobiae bacterium]